MYSYRRFDGNMPCRRTVRAEKEERSVLYTRHLGFGSKWEHD